MKTGKVIDTFADGTRIQRGQRVTVTWPFRYEATYMYPLMGVSNLTNAIVSTGQGAMQIPASLLEVGQ